MKNIYYYDTLIGRIGIAEESGQIIQVVFPNDPQVKFDKSFSLKETDILEQAANQLKEYLQGKRKLFTLPLAPNGTDFMKKVWNSLCDIPYGETRSYKQIAEAAGNVKACRAVGLANNRNPIPLFIPCHRVVGASGKPVGYRGGIETKLKLLEIEKRHGNI